MEHKSKYQSIYEKSFCNHFLAKEYLMETSNYVEARRYAARLNKTADYKAGIEVCAICDTFLIYNTSTRENLMNKSAQPDVSPSELKDIIELFHEKDGLDLIKDKYGEAVLKSDEVKTAIKMARFNKYWQKRAESALRGIQNLEKMSNTYNYHFDRKEVAPILAEINKANKSLRDSFENSLKKFENKDSNTELKANTEKSRVLIRHGIMCLSFTTSSMKILITLSGIDKTNRRLKEIWKETIKKHIEKWKLRPLPGN